MIAARIEDVAKEYRRQIIFPAVQQGFHQRSELRVEVTNEGVAFHTFIMPQAGPEVKGG